MDMETAIAILGINRTRDNDLRPMVKALELFSVLNTPEEVKPLEAAKYVLRRCKTYQAECNLRRDLRSIA